MMLDPMMKDLFIFSATAVASLFLTKQQQQTTTTATTTTAKELSLIPNQALRDGTSLNSTEHVCTVSPTNEPTLHGHSRRDMRLENMWHRATYVVVVVAGSDDRIVVQKRSTQKDYCPGRWDPTPGGVVGFGESYEENTVRELEEEMGIVVVNNADKSLITKQLNRLFTFPYQDERVRVWGELYEVQYEGDVSDLILQESEVDEVVSMSLAEVKDSMASDPDRWMPDARHAMQLYMQYYHDVQLNRRLLRGYSSANMDAYQIRPPPQVVFFDCDDCLYFDNWNVAQLLTHKINKWCVANGLQDGQAYQLYKKYGTALKGLLAEGYIDGTEEAIDEFLLDVHDVKVMDHLEEDAHLRQLLLDMDPSIPKYVFTASVKHHAEKCLKALGIDDLFVDIIDVKACGLETKYSPKSFEAAMRIAGVEHPEACIFLDDSVRNIKAARQVGWRSILVGRIARDTGELIPPLDDSEHDINVIHEFPQVLPELFPKSPSRMMSAVSSAISSSASSVSSYATAASTTGLDNLQ